MPPTNTEIVQELNKIKETIRELERAVSLLQASSELFRGGSEEREKWLESYRRDHAERLDRLRDDLAETKLGVGTLRTEFNELKVEVKEKRTRQWALNLAIFGAITTSLVSLFKEQILRLISR